MKGIVFRELLEMVDEKFGPDVTERVIDAAALPSGGSYTSVGTYDHQEVLALVAELSKETGIPAPALVRAYGKHLFHRLAAAHPDVVKGHHNALTLIESVQGTIHIQVHKLYADAELPEVSSEWVSEGELLVHYRSSRPFAEFCHGLIEGCCEYFGTQVTIEREDLDENGMAADFRITLA